MMFPSKLREKEYIRMVSIRKDKHGNPVATKVGFVKNFEEYAAFVEKYKFTHDVYNQIATNRGDKDGKKTTQRQRRVLFLDFDGKDYPELHDASDFSSLIHEKLPQLFLHACVASGHGFHFYVSIKPTCKIDEVVALNKELVSILGADAKAALTTQITRVPCSYNHKQPDGSYDYEDREKWSYVKVVNNTYGVGSQFKCLDLAYIQKQIDYFYKEQENNTILKKVEWNYQELDDYPCYLCVQKVMHEGADQGQRNFWHGRIVKYLQMNGYTRSKIHSICKEYNKVCRPAKSEKVIEEDTNRFLDGDYKLLGCYETFPIEDKHREWVEAQCDKVNCGTYHNGAKISIDKGGAARINKKVLFNKDLRTMTGNTYLILTLLDVYRESFGRQGFRVKNLKRFLCSSVTKKQCIADRLLKTLLLELENKKWIEIIPDPKQPKKFDECKLILTRRLKEFQKGYIEFYFSAAGALIDGRISQTDYIVFITLVRNLSDGKKVTYDQLADDLNMDAHNVRKYIKKLEKERCLIIQKHRSDKGYYWNKYWIPNSDWSLAQSQDNGIPFATDAEENRLVPDLEKELDLKLLA